MLHLVRIQQGNVRFPRQVLAYPLVIPDPVLQVNVQLEGVVVLAFHVEVAPLLICGFSEDWVVAIASPVACGLMLVAGSADLFSGVLGVEFSRCWASGGKGSQEP